jgi:hypothetical protein
MSSDQSHCTALSLTAETAPDHTFVGRGADVPGPNATRFANATRLFEFALVMVTRCDRSGHASAAAAPLMGVDSTLRQETTPSVPRPWNNSKPAGHGSATSYSHKNGILEPVGTSDSLAPATHHHGDVMTMQPRSRREHRRRDVQEAGRRHRKAVLHIVVSGGVTSAAAIAAQRAQYTTRQRQAMSTQPTQATATYSGWLDAHSDDPSDGTTFRLFGDVCWSCHFHSVYVSFCAATRSRKNKHLDSADGSYQSTQRDAERRPQDATRTPVPVDEDCCAPRRTSPSDGLTSVETSVSMACLLIPSVCVLKPACANVSGWPPIRWQNHHNTVQQVKSPPASAAAAAAPVARHSATRFAYRRQLVAFLDHVLVPQRVRDEHDARRPDLEAICVVKVRPAGQALRARGGGEGGDDDAAEHGFEQVSFACLTLFT